jgi:hypothetical protein
MKRTLIVSIAALMITTIAAPGAEAKGSHSSRSTHASSRVSSGTGSKLSSTYVRGYTKRSGTYVTPSRRSTPDSTTKNNWSTKPNVNPYTGQVGTK